MKLTISKDTATILSKLIDIHDGSPLKQLIVDDNIKPLKLSIESAMRSLRSTDFTKNGLNESGFKAMILGILKNDVYYQLYKNDISIKTEYPVPQRDFSKDKWDKLSTNQKQIRLSGIQYNRFIDIYIESKNPQKHIIIELKYVRLLNLDIFSKISSFRVNVDNTIRLFNKIEDNKIVNLGATGSKTVKDFVDEAKQQSADYSRLLRFKFDKYPPSIRPKNKALQMKTGTIKKYVLVGVINKVVYEKI